MRESLNLMNLFDLPVPRKDEELFETLLSKDNVTIERIVSTGQSTPDGEWYDQDWDEWVVVIQGRAGLLIEGQEEVILESGDHLFLPANEKHRVEWTDQTQETIWLAIHIR